LSNTMLMTCEIPCPRSQEDVAGVAPTAEVVAPVRAGVREGAAIRPGPATPEKRRRLVACVRDDMLLDSLSEWTRGDPLADIATSRQSRHPPAVEQEAAVGGQRGSMGSMQVNREALEELCAALPGDVVTTDPAAVEKYRHDWSRDPSAG